MPKVIQDEFSALLIGRQRKWQLRQVRDGNCKRCGNKRTSYPQLCDPCQLWDRCKAKASAIAADAIKKAANG
jgi:hypothetical protein